MMNRISGIGLLALALAALASCDLLEEEPAGPEGPDLAILAEDLDSLLAVVAPVTLAFEQVTEAAAALERDGADVRDVPPVLLVTIPVHLRGATYVRNPSTHAYERAADGDRAAETTRIVLYRDNGSGALLVPLAEAGYVDLAPNQAVGPDAFDVVMTDADESPIAELTVQGTDAPDFLTYEIDGALSGDPEDVALRLSSGEEGFPPDNFQSGLGVELVVGSRGFLLFHDLSAYEGEPGGSVQFEFSSDNGNIVGSANIFGSAGAPAQVEGVMGAEAYGPAGTTTYGSVLLGGSYSSPTLAPEGSTTSTDRATLERVWSRIVVFTEAWTARSGT